MQSRVIKLVNFTDIPLWVFGCFCGSIVIWVISHQFWPNENLAYAIFIVIFSAGCIYFYLCFKSGYIIQDDGIKEYGHFIKRPFYKWGEIDTVEVFYISNKPRHIVVSPVGAGDGVFGEPYEKLHLPYSKELYSLLLSKVKRDMKTKN